MAPSATARGTPDGIDLYDGFSTKITLAVDDTVELWEKEVTPPGFDGGPEIDRTTMFNTTYRTKHPGGLIDIPAMGSVAAWDPDIYDELTSIINVATTVTVAFCDASTIAFFGYLQKFIPQRLVPNQHPQADITIVATMYDTTADAESVFTLTEVAGT